MEKFSSECGVNPTFFETAYNARRMDGSGPSEPARAWLELWRITTVSPRFGKIMRTASHDLATGSKLLS
jgi:hypothetical protein